MAQHEASSSALSQMRFARLNRARPWLNIPEARGPVLAALASTPALEPGAPSAKRHGEYLNTLRRGIRVMASVTHNEVFVAAAAKKALRSVSPSALQRAEEGVASLQELESLEMWQQGDAHLYVESNVVSRMRLRRDPRVLAVLQMWWEASIRSEPLRDSGTLGFAAYAAIFDRIYRVMVRRWLSNSCRPLAVCCLQAAGGPAADPERGGSTPACRRCVSTIARRRRRACAKTGRTTKWDLSASGGRGSSTRSSSSQTSGRRASVRTSTFS
jgi:hypothetical protein